jgi:hypothetical protein
MKKIKILLMAVIFISTSSFTYAQYLKELKVKDTHSIFNDAITAKQYTSEKSPLLAGSLSFIVPGLALGQIYNNVPSKIFRHLIISIGSFTLLMIAGEFGWFRLDIACGANNHDTWIPYSLGLIYLGNWIWSVVDAVITANNINKKVRIKNNRTFKTDNILFGIGLSRNNKPDFNISVCF